ncbi:protein kinase domain protein [Ichthyophthirius multifiliis]|uniref:Protein kinase domain protein n=1 Tax=Ichthyophthirius multifiliis TaxID=5932 RepID=G0QTI6_ICHMU|nr:protein kinase domain protein [Ichthyophthirius multifiliis]EGR31471.1 protein kinase domain protein [Ichthyophthirius multifiliis]|eukprot:XP_004034957.1 protein kinase domain protein [Ichthyophthirius multifiliis]
MIVSKEPYQKIPDQIIQIMPEWKIQWIYDPKTSKSNNKRIIGFKLLTDNTMKIEYFGDNIIMMTLKDYFSKQIFQLNFLDEYEIIKKIGKGKYAKVYKVRRKIDNKPFAVKYLHKNKLATIEDANDALFNELTILRSLDNKYCIKVISTYEDDNGYYILIELLDFEKIFQNELINLKNYKLGYEYQKLVMKQLLIGVLYVHNNGIMHRDLKPQNLMFATEPEDGQPYQVKIIDFGLAQYVKAKKYIYVHVGTPGFVAPEILNNESENNRYTEKCDLFSIGVIMHIMLTGKQLFPGKRFSQVLESNKKCLTDFTHQRYQDISEEAIDLMKRLLEVNPFKRLSAEEALNHEFFQTEGTLIKKEINLYNQEDFTPLNVKAPKIEVHHNLNQIENKDKKDIDDFKIDFDDLGFKMIHMMPLEEISILGRHIGITY